MEVKPGYKQTEVGVIPEEWNVIPLGEIGAVRMCKRVLKHQTREYGDVPFYKIGTFGDVPDAFISQTLFDDFRRKYSFPRKGDVLISAAGTIGRTVSYDGAPAYFQDSNIVWIDNNESKVTNAYLWHRYQVTKWSVSHGGTVARLYNDNLRTKIHVPVPPLPEQRAIAEALSDVDELLGGLDRLIAKKRDLKQAAMQHLLTGQTRLPGFHGEWEVKSLAAICSMRSGVCITSAAIDQFSTFPCYGGNGLRGFTSSYTHYGSFALIGRQGALCGNVYGVEGRFFASEHAVVVTANPQTDIRWLTSVLARMNLNKYSESSAQPGLSVSKILMLEVKCPPALAEQTAIAEVLADMDAEVAALEQRREKTRALKQAMMQELLTGRIRLV